jgi:hypothetical protein
MSAVYTDRMKKFRAHVRAALKVHSAEMILMFLVDDVFAVGDGTETSPKDFRKDPREGDGDEFARAWETFAAFDIADLALVATGRKPDAREILTRQQAFSKSIGSTHPFISKVAPTVLPRWDRMRREPVAVQVIPMLTGQAVDESLAKMLDDKSAEPHAQCGNRAASYCHLCGAHTAGAPCPNDELDGHMDADEDTFCAGCGLQ